MSINPYPNALDSLAPMRNDFGGYNMGGAGSGSPPKKYVKIDGVTQLNPEWKRWKEGQGGEATSAKGGSEALPVVSSMDDYAELNQVSVQSGHGIVEMAPALEFTMEMVQEDMEISRRVGVASDEIIDCLGELFAKYEVPIGLMNKVMTLAEDHDELEFLIDDSGSMRAPSDTNDAYGRVQTRWEEARGRLKQMMELLALVPTPTITIRFLNRRNEVTLNHNGQTPESWLADAHRQIDRAFDAEKCLYTTPVCTRLEESFRRGQGRCVARYFFGDGVPDGGAPAKAAIEQMIIHRHNPEGNPVTFMSCTNEDDQVEWMKELEEVAPFCAEYDDFDDEAREVLEDQGLALPYTKGLHLIGQVVGAKDPDCLDAMDESVPFTKATLENLLGVRLGEPDYRKYWNGFVHAQGSKTGASQQDVVKKAANWQPHYHEFLSSATSKTIAYANEHRRRLQNI